MHQLCQNNNHDSLETMVEKNIHKYMTYSTCWVFCHRILHPQHLYIYIHNIYKVQIQHTVNVASPPEETPRILLLVSSTKKGPSNLGSSYNHQVFSVFIMEMTRRYEIDIEFMCFKNIDTLCLYLRM